MTPNRFIPRARPEVADEALQRPDWTKSGVRDPRVLWLDKNENTDPAMAAVTARVLAEIDPRSVAVYPNCQPLYAALADYLGVSARSLVLASGSDGVIGSVFRAFVAPGDVVLHPAPTYQMYQVYCRMSGAEAVTVAYEPSDEGPRLSAEVLMHEIRTRRPKLVCLPNPDSPTGTVCAPDVLEAIVACALEVGSLILIDEAYYPFYAHTAIPLIDRYPNVVVAHTFSKAWGLTGLRLGFGVASADTTVLLHKVRPNYEVNEVAVVVGVRMVREYEHEMQASVRRLNQGRDGFLSAMNGAGLRTIHSHASFCHVAFGDSAQAVHASLKDVVLYRENFSEPCLQGFSRFSSTTPELFAPVIDRIRQVVLL